MPFELFEPALTWNEPEWEAKNLKIGINNIVKEGNILSKVLTQNQKNENAF